MNATPKLKRKPGSQHPEKQYIYIYILKKSEKKIKPQTIKQDLADFANESHELFSQKCRSFPLPFLEVGASEWNERRESSERIY